MYASLLVLIPIIACLWIYFLILVKESIMSNSAITSIEFNIIEAKNARLKSSNNAYKAKSDNVPKKERTVHVPKFMLELYENNKEGGNGRKKPDVVRSLIPTEAGPFQSNEVIEELSENHLLIFDLPSSDEDEKFIGAELKVLTLLDVSAKSETGVKRILKISIYDDAVKKLYTFQEIQIHHLNNTWVTFDLTSPVNEMLKSNNKYLKIVITISTFLPNVRNDLKLSLMPIEEDFEHDYPILLLSYSSVKDEKDNTLGNDINVKKFRKKRSLEDDYEEETNKLWDDDIAGKKIQAKKIKKIRNTCRKKPLYINFSEINYDVWIVQPSGYDAYQCQGRCFYPVAEHLNPTKHAIVQSLLHSVSPLKASRSCCVPTILDSISILYVDSNGVLTYRYSYKDMVVVECGCR